MDFFLIPCIFEICHELNYFTPSKVLEKSTLALLHSAPKVGPRYSIAAKKLSSLFLNYQTATAT